MEDDTMEITGQTHFDIPQRQVKIGGAMLFLGYLIFPIALVIAALYFDSITSGMSPADFASMVAFP